MGKRILRTALILLVGMSSTRVALYAPAASSQEEARATESKAEDPVLKLKGTLLMPDGSVAKDVVLEHSEKSASDVLSATINQGQFEIKTTGTNLNNPPILFRTADWNLQALLTIGGHTLRTQCATPQRITLAPTKVIRVKVIDGTKAVAHAHVQVRTGLFTFPGKTQADGVAELKVPADELVSVLYAWTDDHKIGGLSYDRKSEAERRGDGFQIDVSQSEPVRVCVVDARKQPVANVPLTFVVAARGGGGLVVANNPTSSQTTSALGDAVFAWVPDWPEKRIRVGVAQNSAWRMIGEAKKQSDGTLQLEVAPSRASERVVVTGELSGVTSDVSGTLVELWSFQGEETHRMDVVYSRCDARGRFAARVLPGSEYSVFVNDLELVSNTWDGVIISSQGNAVRKPELALTKGVPVEVLATKGRDREPMKHAWVEFQSPHKSLRGRHFWGRTDERGRVAASVVAGELKLRVSVGDWELNKAVQVVAGEHARIHVHRQHADKQTVNGKLMLPLGAATDLRNAAVKIAGMDGESEDATTVTADEQGNFTAKIAAGRISILATSPDEKLFGCGIADVGKDTIEISMHPTISYGGQVLGPADEPLAGIRVRLSARLVDHEREYLPGTPAFRRQYAEYIRDRIVTTDEAGYFAFPATPQKIALTLMFTRPGEGEDAELAAYKRKWFEPGEPTRPAEIIRIRLANATAAKATKPLKEAMSDTLRDCRLAGIHALIIVSGNGDAATRFVATHLSDAEGAHDIYSYLPRKINGPEAAEQADRREYFAARKWPFPEDNSLFLAVLDGSGKELDRLTLDLREEQQAAKDAAAFIKRLLPPRNDAKAGYEAALAEAKRTGRRLWVRVGQTRCAPCYSLSRWLDSQRELLDKDYVLFKFDDVRDLNGRELSIALKFDPHGVPCHAILDSDGKELANSVGPLGNIGDPSGGFEGIEHLRKMLKGTAQKLTDVEIDSLIRTLPQN